VAVCSLITLLIPYYVIYRLVNLIKIIGAPVHMYDTFDLTVIFKLINFSFHMLLLSVPEMST